jgi:DsbC/DsbD-like thiol-disulfide interchange protein
MRSYRFAFIAANVAVVFAALLVAPLGLASCATGGGASRPALPPIPELEKPAGVSPVEARLLADVATLRPGQAFSLGVELRMKPGWHVYWKNPGDAGLPTAIEFVVPDGFVVGALQWPVPVRFDEPGGIVGYGYGESVMLIARVTAPPALAPGAPLRFGAKARWLSCEKVCIPGKADLELALTAGAEAASANRALFDAWSARLPVDGTRPDSPATVRVAPGETTGSRTAYSVLLEWARAPRGVEWFPGLDASLTVESGRIETTGTTTRIRFETETLAGQPAAADVLEVLVAFEDPEGTRRGLTVPVTLVGRNEGRPGR